MKQKYIRAFASKNEIICIFILLGISYIVLAPLLALEYAVPSLSLETNPVISNHKSFTERFIIAVIFGPLIETIIFQWLPIKILRVKFKLSFCVVCTLSAVAFAISHPYGIGYIIFTFILGYLFAAGYIVLRNTNKSAFRVVWVTHALRNLISIGLLAYFG